MPQIDGIVSGYDTSSLITAILSAYTAPEKVVEDKLTTAETKLAAVKEFKSRLDSLSDAVESLGTEDDFTEYAATASLDDYLAVTADADARPGTYDVTVDALSSTETEASNGFADATSTGVIQEGDIVVTYGGEATTITLDSSNNSLEGLATEIDGIDGLQAFVIDTGTASDPYQLVVLGEDTGAANTIEIDTSGLTGAGTTVPTFTEEETATDAQITVNGVTIYNDKDEFDAAIPGLTVDATQVSSGVETRITVGLDETAMQEKVQTFVDAYNDVLGYWDSQTVYNPDLDLVGGLVGDSSLRRIVDTLTSKIGTALTTNSNVPNLSALGISTKESGKVDFDTSDFADALDVDFDEVIALFTDTDGPVKGLQTSIDDVFLADDGTMDLRVDTLEDTVQDLELQLEDWAERKTNMSERLRDQFTSMEIALNGIQANASYLTALSSLPQQSTSSS